MPITDAELLEYAESAFVLLPLIPGRLEALDVDGVAARVSDVDHPLPNMVTCARMTEDDADAAIARLLERYDAANKPVCWMVGPRSRPPDLGDRLASQRFGVGGRLDILVLRELSRTMPSNPDITVCELETGAASEFNAMMAESYGLPEDVIALFNEAYDSSPGNPRQRPYIAYLGGSPVSWGMMLYIPNTTVVLLAGAGTAAEHRGKGIYSTLVARRLADAAADGMDTALIQAVQETSSPICRKLGFEEIGVIDMHFRGPRGAEQQAAT